MTKALKSDQLPTKEMIAGTTVNISNYLQLTEPNISGINVGYKNIVETLKVGKNRTNRDSAARYRAALSRFSAYKN